MAKTVKGFGVRGQDRRKLRKALTGTYEEHRWVLRYEHLDIFWWTIGKMSGYAGPTVGDVLRVMRKAAKAQTALQEVYGDQKIPDETYNSLRLLNRWEQRLLKGKITITGPHGKGDKEHYRVKETSA